MTLVERLTLPNLVPILLIEADPVDPPVMPQAPRLLGSWFVPLVLLIGLGRCWSATTGGPQRTRSRRPLSSSSLSCWCSLPGNIPSAT